MALKSVTDGEFLRDYIYDHLMDRKIGDNLQSKLKFTGRADDLSEFIQEIIVVNMVGRIVVAGSSIADKYHVTDPLFERDLTYYLKNFFDINEDRFAGLYRFAYKAIKASSENISDSVRSRLKQWAMSGHRHCYMCGVQLSFDIKQRSPDDEKKTGFSLEHIWPREYGGNSIEDNLLPSCVSCNSSKKKNFASWAMPSVQSLIRGLDPGDDNLVKIEGSHKFAIHYRYAKNYAHLKNMSLKESFLRVKPWKDMRVINRDDVADFFNLENHDDMRVIYGI